MTTRRGFARKQVLREAYLACATIGQAHSVPARQDLRTTFTRKNSELAIAAEALMNNADY